MTAAEIIKTVTDQFPDEIIESKSEGVLQPFIKVKPERFLEIAHCLRDNENLQFEYLMCLSGMDYGKGILGVVYNLASILHKHKITIKIDVKSESPDIPSVESVWKTADWHEREAYDMFGIVFSGHPDLRRILCPDDWDGHPLRKDYQVQEFYHGMKVPY